MERQEEPESKATLKFKKDHVLINYSNLVNANNLFLLSQIVEKFQLLRHMKILL